MIGSWLSPPRVRIDANLAWLLRAAFAQVPPDEPPESADAALELARSFELSGRVASRQRDASGPPRNGFERALDSDYHTNLAVDTQLRQGLEEVAEIATRHSIPLIALKFAALTQIGALRAGSRVASDLDLLVPADSAPRLATALLNLGFSKSGSREHSHQLEALVGPYGAVVELHVHIPGVHVTAGGFATASDLLDSGLVVKAANSSILVPVPPLLAAHALAHGLLQNRATPQSYSLLRMLADIVDLRRIQETDLLASAEAYLAPPLSGIGAATERLCSALCNGVSLNTELDGEAEKLLLWHCLAARLDSAYVHRLRASGFADQLRTRHGLVAVARYVKGALFPPQRELDAIYGQLPSRAARLRRRWTRPFDVTLRAARHWLRSR
ncbi:MAG TPA: nucleotidyltransferase family protein [Polyangiaceae bacterium]